MKEFLQRLKKKIQKNFVLIILGGLFPIKIGYLRDLRLWWSVVFRDFRRLIQPFEGNKCAPESERTGTFNSVGTHFVLEKEFVRYTISHM